jgi:hypothetical protein
MARGESAHSLSDPPHRVIVVSSRDIVDDGYRYRYRYQ